jgi:hypothetical protein
MREKSSQSRQATTALRLVAVPATVRAENVMVTAVGRSGDDLESVMVTTQDGVRIETTTKPGIRWHSQGLITSDLRMEDAAAQVVTSALLEQIAPAQSRDAARALAETAMEEGRQLGDQVWKPATWTQRSIDVDGETFALFVTELQGCFAAVADIGFSRVTMYGPRLNPDTALRLVPVSALARTADRYPPRTADRMSPPGSASTGRL